MSNITFANISTYESTAEFYTGDIYNIAHDGSAITLGSEPQVSLDSRTLNADFTIAVVFKTSTITQQCIWSVDDGAGARYIDVMHLDGDKLALYFDGITTTITYHTETIPQDEWSFVTIGYDVSENDFHITGGIAGVTAYVTTSYQPLTVPQIPATRPFRFFRPAVINDHYFNGTIENYNILAYFNTLLLNHAATGSVFFNRQQVASWTPNGSNTFATFTVNNRLEFELVQDTTSEYHSFTDFKRNSAICQNRDVFGYQGTVNLRNNGGPLWGFQRNVQKTVFSGETFGNIHYFPQINSMLYINEADQLCSYVVTGENTAGNSGGADHAKEVVVSSNGTYLRARGDLHGRYMFGSKQSTGGDHQIFRTDPDGLNEITVDCLTLLGVNSQIEGLTVNIEDEIIYFGHPTTNLMSSIDFDLTNLTTGTIRLPSGLYSSIEYSNGYLYWGGQFPNADTSFATNSLWRVNVDTNEVQRLGYDIQITNALSNRQTMYIHRGVNIMLIGNNASGGKSYILRFPTDQTENVLGAFYMSTGMQTSTSVDLDWEPVDSAIGYNILQDGVIIENNTPNTYLSVTGLTTDTSYKFTLEYTLDGTNFLTSKFHSVLAHLSPLGHFSPHLPTLFTGSFYASESGFVDPYDPKEIYINHGSNVYKYNFETRVRTLLSTLNNSVKQFQDRQLSNKKVYGLKSNSTTLHDAGVELVNRINAGNINTYYADPAFIVFDHSVTSGGDTANLFSFDSLLDGSVIYYTTQEEVMWKWDKQSNTSVQIYAGEGTNNMGSLRIDPLNQNDMIFMDNQILKRIDLTTLVVTDIRAASASSHFELLNGVIYGCNFVQSYFKVNIDGTGYEDIHKPAENFDGMYLDTVNKRVILFEDFTMVVIPDPTIADLPTDPSLFTVNARPLSLDMSWEEQTGATKYRVAFYQGTLEDPQDEITADGNISIMNDLKYSIRNLTVETNYVVSLYYSTTGGPANILVGSANTSTAANLPGNYDATSFAEDNGSGFDLSELNPATLATFGEVMNELFSLGDEISLMVGGITRDTKFMKRGDTLVIPQEEREPSLSIPFSGTDAGQEASLTLTDDLGASATYTVEYDATEGSISLDGGTTNYVSGQSFVLNGKKVTIAEF